MFEEYLKDILALYEKKKSENTLPPNLSHPTPGNFRSECITVFSERPLSSDDEALRLFFGAADNEMGFARNIENSKAVQYKQMPKILKRDISSPNRKYIELLAWLINFNHRPFAVYISRPVPPDNKPKPHKPLKFLKPSVIIIVSTFVILVIGCIFFVWKAKMDSSVTKKCMYWATDHYEPVDCNEKIDDIPIVSLDTRKLSHFKKITLPDTLTKNSINKVWYLKPFKWGNPIFFTDSGVHPIDTLKKLKPMSDYILRKYVSYHRYLLRLVIWSISAIILLSLCSVFFIGFRRKRKKKMLALTSPNVLA
ncbi:hypothetical protein SAMN05421820_10498 [Pedobacter steynii]|uniref:Uncharacterized protein n=1 Tax=Pedobacter steynii TaxID=430522 RepID=A0A1G9U9L7_9SPHI|nr:hypothetical protein [Pedobacter steynii]NQX40694.1 hypothetical protein [Pedobacter steynii]SDM56245.1 hypothetical protein SAMN05421820_10498 [Pedobacter steynii]